MAKRKALIALLISSLVAPVALGADAERLRNAEAVLTEMAGAADKGIPTSLIGKAQCIAIIPGVKKGAIGIGGQYGRGYISCRTDDRKAWSAPGGLRIEGGSIGLQLGGTDTDLILLVMPGRGPERLLSNKFTVGADAAVAAGPVGRQTSAQTDATMMAEMLAWSRARGVFAGISLQGSSFRDDSGENKELYGRDITNKEIVSGKVPVPKGAEGLMKALSKY
ncbi:MAG TPA: lipid-binding SYLF domain-containing protein [Vicinamibacterales bacterium]|nr:lipid-binding SYLF domain-containing protein [Vicinamibacterales bacterium]